MSLTAERLRELLDYDPSTGVFSWRYRRRGVRVDGPVGVVSNALGYRLVSIDHKKYYAHRLVWFWVMGEWPVQIDHINGKRDNNRIENLRNATSRQNKQNASIRSDNSTGYKGVRRESGRYLAAIKVNGKNKRIGIFDTPELAHAAYCKSACAHFGEFANDGRYTGC